MLNIKELLQQIEDEKKYLFNKTNNVDEEVEFFKEFKPNFSSSIINSLINIDIFDFITAFIISNNQDFSFEEVKYAVEQMREICSDNSMKFLFLISNIDTILKEMSIDEFQNKQKSINFFNKNKKLKTALKIINSFDEEKIYPFMKIHSSDKDLIYKMGALVLPLFEVRKSYDTYQRAKLKAKFKNNIELSEKEGEILFSQITALRYKLDNINEEFKSIERYGDKVISKDKNEKRKIRKELNFYMYLSTWLKDNKNKKEITTTPKEINQIRNKELSISILKYIYCHNMNEYNNLNKEYNELLSNSYNKYHLLFSKYKIDISNYNIDISKDIKQVENMLEIIHNIGIKSPECIISITNNSKPEIVENIKNLFQKGYISEKFIIENIDIFNENYLNLISNIELFKSENLSISNIRKLETTLNKDTIIIQKNIDILKEYDLFSKVSSSSNFNFMTDEQLEDKIDNILELGLEQFLEEDLNLLNKDKETLKKVIILKRLNIPINNMKELESILEKQNSILKDDSIDNYIFDINNYNPFENLEEKLVTKDEFYKTLGIYNNTKRTYNINGIFISKNKVKRYIDNIDCDNLSSKEQLNSIIEKTILDKDELENITKCLFYKEKQYKK